mgnify:FL=1
MLVDIIKQRTLDTLGWDESVLDRLINADDSVMHDPFTYTNMERLIDKLHDFATKQTTELVVVDTDYDTDGIMSACVLTAALSVFGINHRVYIPSMKDGYGLSPKAVDEMISTFNNVSLILTADNGTNAIDGINRAKDYGIPVLVTDHHLGSSTLAPADVIVNPNVLGDHYPFKGNAGATVAWKTMMAYAIKYQPDKISLIRDLVVFAGIANVADMMPIIDENHYMVRLAVETLSSYQELITNNITDYTRVKYTGIIGYDTVFHGLFDCIYYMQTVRDSERQSAGKKPSPLPTDEELISWYLSPLLNAPRRVVGTPVSAFKGLIHFDPTERKNNILQMIQENKQKSIMRDAVLSQINESHYGDHSTVIFVNAQHGIAGLIASSIVNKTQKPVVVFASPSESIDKVYHSTVGFEYIQGSARSTDVAPLDVIIGRIREDHPNFKIDGGGHAQAAGFGIETKDYERFVELFDHYAGLVATEVMLEYAKAVDEGTLDVGPENKVRLSFYDGITDDSQVWYNINRNNFGDEILGVVEFWSQLKPFGKGFDAKTSFTLDIDPEQLYRHGIDFNFWGGKAFKSNVNGCEILTFDQDLTRELRQQVQTGDRTIIPTKAEVKVNKWMGRVTPQLILSKG